MKKGYGSVSLLWCLGVCGASTAWAQSVSSSPSQESMADAWWTGPMLANSAETLPPGHFLLEPYLYDIRSPHTDSFGSRTYILYGLANRLSIGVIPVFGHNRVDNGLRTAGIGVGDITLQAQYRLTEFQPGGWMPTTAIQLQETLPTGRYDRLGNHPSNGLGSGTYTTTIAMNSQTYFWLPNGRILRTRFDISEAFSRSAHVRGVSVYDTPEGFDGDVNPGRNFFADLAFEYSLTQRWVLATDFTYSHNNNTRITGQRMADSPSTLPYPQNIRIDSGNSTAFGVAPAIEYNWSSRMGVLFGTRVIFGGHNQIGTVTPAIAINYVY